MNDMYNYIVWLETGKLYKTKDQIADEVFKKMGIKIKEK